jgi:hypothetical protein
MADLQSDDADDAIATPSFSLDPPTLSLLVYIQVKSISYHRLPLFFQTSTFLVAPISPFPHPRPYIISIPPWLPFLAS